MCFNSHLFLQYYVQFPLVDSSIPLIIPSYLDPPTIQIPWNPHQKSPSTTMKNPHQLTINPPDLTFIGCAFLREWLCGLQHIFHCEIWGICNIQLGSFLGYHMVIIYLGVSKERGTPFHHPYFRLAFSLTKTIQLLGIPVSPWLWKPSFTTKLDALPSLLPCSTPPPRRWSERRPHYRCCAPARPTTPARQLRRGLRSGRKNGRCTGKIRCELEPIGFFFDDLTIKMTIKYTRKNPEKVGLLRQKLRIVKGCTVNSVISPANMALFTERVGIRATQKQRNFTSA